MIVKDHISRVPCEWGSVILIAFQETVDRVLLLLFSLLGQGFNNGVPTYLIGKIRKPKWKVHCFIDELRKIYLLKVNKDYISLVLNTI